MGDWKTRVYFSADVVLRLPMTLQEAMSMDQLRAPLETLVANLVELTGLHPDHIVMVGEASLAGLKARPNYTVTYNNVLVGFIEIKAPAGKGADPRRFRDRHDKDQWTKLQTLPNLIYTDGNGFSLWRNGELQGTVVQLVGDVEIAGNRLAAPDEGVLSLLADFLQWEPQPPRSAQEPAEMTARLCRLLREDGSKVHQGRKLQSGAARWVN